SAQLSLQEEFPSPPLRAVTADGEEDIHATANQILHGAGLVHRTARGTENCAALQMNPIHHFVCENERLSAVFRIQPLIAPAEAEHFSYAVSVMQFKK